MMWRQEWQPSVYAQISTALTTRISVPSPMPKPPSSPWKAMTASYVRTEQTRIAA